MQRTVSVSAVSAMTIWYMIKRKMQDLEFISMKMVHIQENQVSFMTEDMLLFVKSMKQKFRIPCMQIQSVSIQAELLWHFLKIQEK